MVNLLVSLLTLVLTLGQTAQASSCVAADHEQVLKDIKENSHDKIVFFATWCHSCLPKLKSLSGSEILVVAFDDHAKAEKALRKLQIKNKCYYGETILEHFEVKSLPFEIML